MLRKATCLLKPMATIQIYTDFSVEILEKYLNKKLIFFCVDFFCVKIMVSYFIEFFSTLGAGLRQSIPWTVRDFLNLYARRIRYLFDKNFDFRQKFQFSTKISIFDKNFNFRQKFRFLTKNSIFDKKFDF